MSVSEEGGGREGEEGGDLRGSRPAEARCCDWEKSDG